MMVTSLLAGSLLLGTPSAQEVLDRVHAIQSKHQGVFFTAHSHSTLTMDVWFKRDTGLIIDQLSTQTIRTKSKNFAVFHLVSPPTYFAYNSLSRKPIQAPLGFGGLQDPPNQKATGELITGYFEDQEAYGIRLTEESSPYVRTTLFFSSKDLTPLGFTYGAKPFSKMTEVPGRQVKYNAVEYNPQVEGDWEMTIPPGAKVRKVGPLPKAGSLAGPIKVYGAWPNQKDHTLNSILQNRRAVVIFSMQPYEVRSHKMIQQLVALYPELQSKGIECLGVKLVKPGTTDVAEVGEELQVPFPLALHALPHSMHLANPDFYPTITSTSTYLIDKDKKIVGTLDEFELEAFKKLLAKLD